MDKPIDWRGSSLDDLREFPEAARKQAGYDLRKLQRGQAPEDWRPFPEVGAGLNEIRIDCSDGWFRVMYVAKFEECIYVLHSFGHPEDRQEGCPDCRSTLSRGSA